jgi:hypothetical protein
MTPNPIGPDRFFSSEDTAVLDYWRWPYPGIYYNTGRASLRQDLVKLLQYLINRRPIRDARRDVTPEDRPVRRKDEGRRSGDTIVQQVVDAIFTRDRFRGVRQHWIFGAGVACHLYRFAGGIGAQRNQPDVPIDEPRVILLQLAELSAADPSKQPAVEHEDQSVSVLEQFVQRDLLPIGARQRELRSNVSNSLSAATPVRQLSCHRDDRQQADPHKHDQPR